LLFLTQFFNNHKNEKPIMKTRKLMQAVASVTAVIATMGVSLDALAATKADHDKEVIGYVTEGISGKTRRQGFQPKVYLTT
jgi:hypothetical protein